MITDPAALHHIFVRSGYRYPKQPDRTILATLIGGKGILWAEGGFLATGSKHEMVLY
jgi:hypothetical protein